MRTRIVYSGNVEGSGGPAAPVSSDPAPTTGAPETGGGLDAVEQDINALFNFDPFEPPAEPAPPAAGVEPTPAPQVTPIPAVQAPPTGQPPAPAPQPGPAPDPLLEAANALRETAAALPQAVREAAAPSQPQGPAPDPWAPVAPEGEQLNYAQIMSQMPPQMLQALGSENPAERNHAVVSMLATTAHLAHRMAVAQSVQMMRQEFARAVPTFVQRSIQEHQQQQQVFTDFYGKFPSLSDPRIRPIVLQEAQRLAAQRGVRGWTPEFRDALGEHVMSMLRGVVPGGPPVQQAPAPMMSPPSVRPPAPTNLTTPEAEMAELLRY